MDKKVNIEPCEFCHKEHSKELVCTGNKPKVLFVFDIANTTHWRDGLWAALKLLETDFDITYWNLGKNREIGVGLDRFDFILGWSSFDGEIAHLMRNLKVPHGLCIGGYMFEPHNINHFNVLFYETEWYADAELKPRHPNAVHAFGINTDIFHPQHPRTVSPLSEEEYKSDIGIVTDGAHFNDFKIFDYLTVGSFSAWKRQIYLLRKEGNRMAVGYLQNTDEAFAIISELLLYGCGVMGECAPEDLVKMINASKCVYIPATIAGGGERSVLEARACDVAVEIEDDNPKLKELLTSPVWDQHYYAAQLKKGIESCLGSNTK
jgi:hypothetical protein